MIQRFHGSGIPMRRHQDRGKQVFAASAEGVSIVEKAPVRHIID
jgi:hypothetical protein